MEHASHDSERKVDPARLEAARQKLAEMGLEDFADLEVSDRGVKGTLVEVASFCPPEHLDSPRFEEQTLGLIAITLAQEA
jgi:hypothetical protein